MEEHKRIGDASGGVAPGAQEYPRKMVMMPPPNTIPEIQVEKKLLKLDLGSANRPREGFESVDLYHPDATHKVDLWKFPFPWADNSVEELSCTHFLEHLPAREVLRSECNVRGFKYENWDFFFAFMSECYRILIPGGKMFVVVPNARCNRAFQDPTHRRFFVAETFFYLSKEWRIANGLDHYQVDCDFAGDVNPAIPQELSLFHPDVQAKRFMHEWNTVMDWHAVLISKKPQ